MRTIYKLIISFLTEICGSYQASLLQKTEKDPDQNLQKSWLHVRCEEKFPGELYEADVLLLTELVAVQGDVASQARHPGDKPRSELPEQDRRGEVEFDLLQPLLTLPVQLGGVWEVVVVQALSLVYIWGEYYDDDEIGDLDTAVDILPSLSAGSSAML